MRVRRGNIRKVDRTVYLSSTVKERKERERERGGGRKKKNTLRAAKSCDNLFAFYLSNPNSRGARYPSSSETSTTPGRKGGGENKKADDFIFPVAAPILLLSAPPSFPPPPPAAPPPRSPPRWTARSSPDSVGELATSFESLFRKG